MSATCTHISIWTTAYLQVPSPRLSIPTPYWRKGPAKAVVGSNSISAIASDGHRRGTHLGEEIQRTFARFLLSPAMNRSGHKMREAKGEKLSEL